MAQRAQHTPADIERLRAEVARTEHELENAKLAYFNSASYKDGAVPFDALKEYAEAFIAANHALQKALYGRVRIRLDVSRLLRE